MKLIWFLALSLCLTVLLASALLATTSHCDDTATSCPLPDGNNWNSYSKTEVSRGNCICCVDLDGDGVPHYATCLWIEYRITWIHWDPLTGIPSVTEYYCSERNPANCVASSPPAPCTAPPAGGD